MGRYDNFKYFNGTDWVQPSEVHINNGSFISLGTNTSDSSSNFKVKSDSGFVNAAKTKQIVYGDKYIDSLVSNDSEEFKVKANGTDMIIVSFCMKISSQYADEQINVFNMTNSSITTGISVQNGVFYIIPYKNTPIMKESLGTFPYDTWVNVGFSIRGQRPSTTAISMTISSTGDFDGSATYSGSGYSTLSSGFSKNRVLTIGSEHTSIKGEVYAQSYNTTGITFNVSDISTVGQAINYTHSDTVTITSTKAVEQEIVSETWV